MDRECQELSELWLDTPIGPMRALADATHLHALEFHDEPPSGATAGTASAEPLRQIESELRAYFAGESADFRTPLRIGGNALERKVWERLARVPLGETCSYGDIARDVGHIESVRVIARYCGTNRVPVVIPCHRCIGSDGSLIGFGGGLWRKKWLLRHEGRMRPVGLFAEERH
ncbi:AraC family transcriptional regulator of adaptative response/methylated-DNA-[protein]-cysteine methyltransferase [Hoeflea marina]|uniref:methylated-DNA--[protein]-cysteine S-methyltransferase n=1 Tax=Hoeflea marina TaxID=274592 RepID=A0A317PHY7_9HYPH|nr:AraC family transcriptional regulator of adaptative response/methylated-DNA-[protein]-cysteine methyltransferase [Hoeflea marina]